MAMTADRMALEILMDGRLTDKQRQTKLTALQKAVHKQLHPECPECGSTDVDDNGDTYFGVTCCCLTCGYQWQRDGE